MGNSSNPLFDSLWPGLTFWSILYISDYYLTLACARLYRAGVQEKIVLQGSYEITPYFQSDIDSLRSLSPRFLAAFLWTTALLSAVWWLSLQSTPVMYQVVLGAMLSLESAIHIRHFRNLFLFRESSDPAAVRGRIEYSRTLMLRMSAVELLAFSGLFGLALVFTQSWFVFGGAVSCLVTASKHLKLARKTNTPLPSKATGALARQ